MQYMNIAAIKVRNVIPSNSIISVSDTVELYYAAINPLFQYLSLRIYHARRYERMLWKKVFNMVCKNKGRFANEISN